MNKIIFGGAFDPIHNGHINMAIEASKQLNADVIFVPAKISVWKENSGASIENKIKMLEIAIRNYSQFSISRFEADSNKDINYSIDTIKYFKKEYPNDELYLLIGTDQVNQFDKWKDATYIASLCHIAYFDRPGYITNSEMVLSYNMINIEGSPLNISSSDIKGSIKCNVDYDVAEYIVQNKLYFMPQIAEMMSIDRYIHTCSVALLSYKIALSNRLSNPYRCFIAGILHDIGKEYKNIDGVMSEHFKEYLDMPRFSYHQFVGSYLAEQSFGIKNQDILDAIKFHTTGNKDMTDVAMIVYAADKIDPTRGYDSKDFISSMMNNYFDGFKIILKANKEYLNSKNKIVEDKLTQECFNSYL